MHPNPCCKMQEWTQPSCKLDTVEPVSMGVWPLPGRIEYE